MHNGWREQADNISEKTKALVDCVVRIAPVKHQVYREHERLQLLKHGVIELSQEVKSARSVHPRGIHRGTSVKPTWPPSILR